MGKLARNVRAQTPPAYIDKAGQAQAIIRPGPAECASPNYSGRLIRLILQYPKPNTSNAHMGRRAVLRTPAATAPATHRKRYDFWGLV